MQVLFWDNEPLGSGELVKLCNEKLGWKKYTTYTVLKKLCDREILKNENAIVSAIVKREQVQKFESEQFLNKTFNGSLPHFITSIMSDKKLSKAEADELKKCFNKNLTRVLSLNEIESQCPGFVIY